MIINLNQFGGGGGGSYVLPVASQNTLGGVKIGSGLSITSAGTLSTDANVGTLNYNQGIANSATTRGFAVDIKYINSDYSGFIGSRSNNYGGGQIYTFSLNLNTDGELEWTVVDGEDFTEYASGTVATQGTYTLCQGELYEVVLTWSGSLVDVAFSGGEMYYDYTMPDIPILYYEDDNDTYYVAQRQSNASTPQPSDVTIVKSLSEAPTGLTDGDTIILQEAKEMKMCKVIDDSGNTLNVGHYTWGDMGEPAYLIVNSNAVEDTLAIQFNYYAYKTYVYTGEDGFRYEVTENDEFSSSGAISSTVNVTMGDYTLYFSLLNANSLNIGLLSNVEFNVWQRVDSDKTETSYRTYAYCENETPSVDIYLGSVYDDGTNYFYTEAEFYFDQIPSFTGSAFTICTMTDAGSPESRRIKYTSAGTYVWEDYYGNTVELVADGKVHTAYDGRIDKYVIEDGYIKVIATSDSSSVMSSLISEDENLWNNQIMRTGLVEIGRRGLVKTGQKSYGDFVFRCNGQQRRYTSNGINITEAPYPVGGNKVLFSPTLENMEWRDLPVAVEIVNALPTFADDGAFVVVNTGVTPSASTAFCAKNTTSSDGKNNFSDYDEFAPYETMNFVNGDLSSTAKTLIGRIAMRTYDWDWNSVAYINVFREYDSVNQTYFFSWDMPPYDYEDNEGQHHTYSTSGVVDSAKTSVDSMVIPIARLYYDGFGYRFNFTYDNGNLAISMLYDNDNGTYGDVNVRFTNHTTEFYNGMSTEGNATTLYTFKGGAWYKLGDLA